MDVVLRLAAKQAEKARRDLAKAKLAAEARDKPAGPA